MGLFCVARPTPVPMCQRFTVRPSMLPATAGAPPQPSARALLLPAHSPPPLGERGDRQVLSPTPRCPLAISHIVRVREPLAGSAGASRGKAAAAALMDSHLSPETAMRSPQPTRHHSVWQMSREGLPLGGQTGPATSNSAVTAVPLQAAAKGQT